MPGSPIDVEVALLNLVRAVGDEPALAPFRQARRGAGRRERIDSLSVTQDLKLIKPDDYEKLAQQTTEIKRMLTVFVQKLTAEG